jgi:hypothetical protein
MTKEMQIYKTITFRTLYGVDNFTALVKGLSGWGACEGRQQ